MRGLQEGLQQATNLNRRLSLSAGKTARLAAMLVFCLALVSGAISPSPVYADEKSWKLAETVRTPESGKLEIEGSPHSWSMSETSMDHWFRFGGAQPVDSHQQFTFTRPGDQLIPGTTVTLKVNGKSMGSDPKISGETLVFSAEGVRLEGKTNVSVGFATGPLTNEGTASFVVPDISAVSEISITASLFTATGESRQGFSLRWVYRYGGKRIETLDLEHYHPFDYFQAGTGVNIAPAGDLVATLRDQDGKPIEGKLVFFYAKKELNTGQLEPGNNLRGILRPYSGAGSANYPIFNIFDIDEETFWTSEYTDRNGEARVSYLHPSYSLIDGEALAVELQRQTGRFNIEGKTDGKISGTVKAAVILNYDRLGPAGTVVLESMPVTLEYRALARILDISGEGQPDNTTEGIKYPGRVRVKRETAFPKFDYTPVETGFFLMPGDIIDIDGNTSVEIAWINGDKAIARVPGTLYLQDTELPVYHARMALLGTAYESGFMTTTERLISKFTGASIGKGIEVLIESIPYIGEGVKFGVDVYNEGEFDFKKQGIMAKIRVRSNILIDTTGTELRVFNFEGSPDVKTSGGGEISLNNEQMVAVSFDGILSASQPFDTAQVKQMFLNAISAPAKIPGKISQPQQSPAGVITLPHLPPQQRLADKPGNSGQSGFNWYFVGAGAALIVLVVILIRRRKQK